MDTRPGTWMLMLRVAREPRAKLAILAPTSSRRWLWISHWALEMRVSSIVVYYGGSSSEESSHFHLWERKGKESGAKLTVNRYLFLCI